MVRMISVGFMARKVKSRSYDNAARTESSSETRQRIVEAAGALMIERGYRSTTIVDIASSVGVHVDTVYQLVGRKPVLLHELIEQAISGQDHAIDAEDRGYVKAVRAEPDPWRKLALYARAVLHWQERIAPLFTALRDAATTEPEVQQVWRSISDRRAANMRKLAGELRATGALRPGFSIDEAADTIWAMSSSDLYVLLTVERGWSPEHYGEWLASSWQHLLLTPTSG